MTEDEAKTRWCPMVRIVAANDHIQENRHGQFKAVGAVGKGPFCIGSACMMYRHQLSWQFYASSDGWQWKRHGYCGLAR